MLRNFPLSRCPLHHWTTPPPFQPDIYSPLLKKISDIFENMKLIKPEIIKEIDLTKKDVYDNENLTSYFENKLSMLLEIGYLK